VQTAQAQTEQWKFKVFLDGKPIGDHVTQVKTQGNTTSVEVDANFKVKFWFYTAFDYKHHAEEQWQGKCLKSVDTTTVKSTEKSFIKMQDDQYSEPGKKFYIETHEGKQTLNGCIRTFAYWQPELLDADHLLNTDTGVYEETTFKRLGNEKKVINSRSYATEKYKLTVGDKVLYIWYTKTKTNPKDWLALESVTADGYEIQYYSEKAYD